MTKGRILIVEDDVLQGKPLEGQLLNHGYDVVGIATAINEAIEMAKAKKPDLVLMDVWLPPQPGGDDDREGGIKAARKILMFSSPAVVFLTAKDVPDQTLKQVVRTSGTPQFLTKPVEERQLLTAIELGLLRTQGKRVIFLCYAHADASMKEELVRFLRPMEKCGVETWHDGVVPLGDRWKIEIEGAIRRADAAIVLVSIDFINSRFVHEFELPALLAAEAGRGLKVIPAYVGAVPRVLLERNGFLDFQGINPPDAPLNNISAARRESEAWKPLCDRAFENMSV